MRPKPGTVFCVLCQGIVTYNDGDSSRFNDHMNIEHGAYYNLRYLLAGSLMSKEERNIVAEIIEERNDNNEADVMNGDVSDSILDKAFPFVNANKDDCTDSSFLNSVSEPTEKPFKCNLCESSFGKNNYLARHLLRFHKLSKQQVGENDSSIQGQEMKMEVSYETLPTLEIREEVLEQKANVCHLCDANFSSAGNLKRHLLRVHKISNNEKEISNDISPPKALNYEVPSEADPKKCELCETVFSHPSSLRRHQAGRCKANGDKLSLPVPENYAIQEKRSEVESFKCDLCDYSCTKTSSLKIHKTMKHKTSEKLEEKIGVTRTVEFKKKSEQDNKYDCGKCDFSCFNEKELRYHRFKNHRHALMKRSAKVESDSRDEEQSGDELENVINDTNDSILDSSKSYPMLNVEINSDADISVENSFTEGDELQGKNVKCGLCESSFAKVSYLNRHLIRFHKLNKEERDLVHESRKNTDQDQLLVEDPEEKIADASLEVNDLETIVGESEIKEKRNKRLKHFNERKKEIIERSEYFKTYPTNMISWTGSDEDLLPAENLPQGWGVKSSTGSSGKTSVDYVTPDRLFRLRSFVSAFEYVKCCGLYTDSEILAVQLTMTEKSS